MSEATNGTDCQHDSDNGMTEEQKKQKELDDMAAANSDTEFEQLLSEVGCSVNPGSIAMIKTPLSAPYTLRHSSVVVFCMVAGERSSPLIEPSQMFLPRAPLFLVIWPLHGCPILTLSTWA